MRVTALAGGVGAARLLRGVARVVPAECLSIIVNTADDEEFHGLHVSPDLDTTVYNLAGVAPRGRGWGLAGDTLRTLTAQRELEPAAWFRLGDQDLATHLYRTRELRAGRKLHEVTHAIARAFGVRSRVLPMSNDEVRTRVHTPRGVLSFQDYFVRRRARDRVLRLSYRGLRAARPAPGVLAVIRSADAILLPPSNPFTSLRPILGLPGVERALRRRRAPLVAVAPVAGGKAVRGPLGGMLRSAGLPVSPLGITRLYRGLLDGLVIDSTDAGMRQRLEREGVRVAVAEIRMGRIERSMAVAKTALELARSIAAS